MSKHLLRHLKPMQIQSVHLIHIRLYASHLYGSFRTDDRDASLLFHALHHLQLCVVSRSTRTQGLTQLRITGIDEGWQMRRLLPLPIPTMPRENHDSLPVSLTQGTLQRYRVSNAVCSIQLFSITTSLYRSIFFFYFYSFVCSSACRRPAFVPRARRAAASSM